MKCLSCAVKEEDYKFAHEWARKEGISMNKLIFKALCFYFANGRESK